MPSTPGHVSLLDFPQIIKEVFDQENDSLQVRNVSGNLITLPYDYQELTYVAGGYGIGEIETITYKMGGPTGTLSGVITLTYNSDNKISSIYKSS